MKTKYDNGEISISIRDLFQYVTKETKVDLIQALSCDDEIIDYVVQQISEGCTDNGSFGGMLVTASDNPINGLDKAKRDLAKSSGKVAKEEIERLEGALKYSEERRQKAEDELYKRNHSQFA